MITRLEVVVVCLKKNQNAPMIDLLSIPQSRGKKCFSHSVYWLPTRKKLSTLHGGQSHSWSAEQGKENKMRKSGSAPLPPRCSCGENNITIT